MKKKVALLLATTMAVTLVPTNAFAASQNALTLSPNVHQINEVLTESTAWYVPVGFRPDDQGSMAGHYMAEYTAKAVSDGGVTVADLATAPVTIDGITYAAGTFTVDAKGNTTGTVTVAGSTVTVSKSQTATALTSSTVTVAEGSYAYSPSQAAYGSGTLLAVRPTPTMMRSGVLPALQPSFQVPTTGENSSIRAAVRGGELVIIPNGYIEPGAAVKLTLSNNASWFFRNVDTNADARYGYSASNPNYNKFVAGAPSQGIPSVIQKKMMAVNGGTPELTQIKYDLKATYDITKGMYLPFVGTYNGATIRGEFGRYIRHGNGASLNTDTVLNVAGVTVATASNLSYSYNGVAYEEVPYVLDVLQLPEAVNSNYVEAIVTFPVGANQGSTSVTNPWSGAQRPAAIVIPLVSRVAQSGDITVDVGNAIAAITPGKVYMGSSTGATNSMTTTTVEGQTTAKYEFPNTRVRIDEVRLGSLANGKITMTAPSGFYFANTFSTVAVTGYAGLAGTTIVPTVKYSTDSYYYSQGVNNQQIEIDLTGIKRSSVIHGSLFITGLKLYAEDNAPDGDIKVTVKGVENAAEGGRTMMTEETVVFGKKGNWVSTLTAASTPTLFSGRYNRDYDVTATTNQQNLILDAMNNSQDAEHKTGRITFAEDATFSWWANRVTTLTLSEGAKFRKVRFIDTTDNVVEEAALVTTKYYDHLTGVSALPAAGVFLNDGIRHGNVTVDENRMVLSNLSTVANKSGKLVFDAWISIEPGKTGDITLSAGGTVTAGAPTTVSGTDITNVANGYKNPSAVIAKAIAPVTVTKVDVADVKIGYQYQSTGNIIITENVDPLGFPGLKKGRQVLVTLTDLISTDLLLAPDAKVQVTTNNGLTISNITSVTNGYASRYGNTLYGNGTNNGGTLGFTIMSESMSGKASVITISNVQVKVDRSVPESNVNLSAYKVLVWGTAVGENFGRAKDQFSKAGITEDYAKVISVANDKAGVLSQVVKFPIGEKYYIRGNDTIDMPAASYISPASNSTMVPVRYVANSLGITDEQIVYDAENKTATFITPNRVIQFQVDSSEMILNGARVTMYSPAPEKLPVKAELTGEGMEARMYVPMRALGEAMGVKVDFLADTQTAVYSPIEVAATAKPAATK